MQHSLMHSPQFQAVRSSASFKSLLLYQTTSYFQMVCRSRYLLLQKPSEQLTLFPKAELIMKYSSPFKFARSSLHLSLLILFCFGCDEVNNNSRGERLPVSGLVYYDGDPLTSAQIVFISETPEGKMKSAGIVREGIFQIPEQGGPVAGTARIEIYPTIPEMEEMQQLMKQAKEQGKPFIDPSSVKIPATYNKNSNLTAEVTPDGNNRFDFRIESK